MANYVDGIDVSVYQGNINWQQVKDHGIRYVFIKTSEGTGFTDPKWYLNRDGARAVGIPWSGYHFARPSGHHNDVISEANTYINAGGHLGPLPPVLDLEASELNREDTIKWAEHWCHIVKEARRRAGLPDTEIILYAGAYWMGEAIASDPRLRSCYWWLPNYGTNQDNPSPPQSWITRTNNDDGEQADVWQYSSRGKVPGIGGGRADVDMNVMPIEKFYQFLNPEHEEIEMNIEELRMEMTGQTEYPVSDVYSKWIGDAKRSIYVILDGRTGKYWAVWGLFRLELENEAWAGWWAERPDVNPVYKFGPVTEGKWVAMIDQSIVVRYGENRFFLSSIDGEGITVDADIDTEEISEDIADKTAERVAQLLENGTITTEFVRG